MTCSQCRLRMQTEPGPRANERGLAVKTGRRAELVRVGAERSELTTRSATFHHSSCRPYPSGTTGMPSSPLAAISAEARGAVQKALASRVVAGPRDAGLSLPSRQTIALRKEDAPRFVSVEIMLSHMDALSCPGAAALSSLNGSSSKLISATMAEKSLS